MDILFGIIVGLVWLYAIAMCTDQAFKLPGFKTIVTLQAEQERQLREALSAR